VGKICSTHTIVDKIGKPSRKRRLGKSDVDERMIIETDIRQYAAGSEV
jgi:hypothetical protein